MECNEKVEPNKCVIDNLPILKKLDLKQVCNALGISFIKVLYFILLHNACGVFGEMCRCLFNLSTSLNHAIFPSYTTKTLSRLDT